MITAYVYNGCSSCRKAVALLEEEGASYRVREFFKARLSEEELRGLLSDAGLTVEDVLSTRSTPYRDLGLAEHQHTDDELIAAMVREPRLLKRPLLIFGGGAVVGYKADAIRELVHRDAGS